VLFDTHCHIHEPDYPLPVNDVLVHARSAGVQHIVCVGTSQQSSHLAIDFAANESDVYATIGVHPHDTKDGYDDIRTIADAKPNNLIAIGEIGLDYFYSHSPRDVQIQALRDQIQVALDHDLAIVFHVRDAFDDFWPIFDSYDGIRGVLHSFTDNKHNLDEALRRGLYIGVNGISTFTKDHTQKNMFASIPLNRLLLETDAPFLTPVPFRGKVNEPAFVKNIAEFHAELRGVSLSELAAATTTNARALFAL
jgi:TatD DNase family protein